MMNDDFKDGLILGSCCMLICLRSTSADIMGISRDTRVRLPSAHLRVSGRRYLNT